jgi:hypothetical protein
MEIVEVNTPALDRAFIQVQVDLYRSDKNYIRPLDQDVNHIFDPKKNKVFKDGQLKRWLLMHQGKAIGRVAAFLNPKTISAGNIKAGGMGFFDCIDSQEAANLLFDTCLNYLKGLGLEAMDGPVNFGERDRFWGLLIGPYDPPTYLMNYNFPYYQQLFENYGFQLYFKQFTFLREFSAPLPDKYRLKAERIARDPMYAFSHVDSKHLDRYAEEFRKVYNEAWGNAYQGFNPLSSSQAKSVLKSLKPIMVDHLIWFGYYDHEPISFMIILPEMNRIFKNLHGQLNLWGKIKFMWYRYVVPIEHTYGMVFGVSPSHQRKGVEGAMIQSAANLLQPLNRYKTLELNWIGDFNPKMLHVVENVGARKYRTYHTYRYLFDRTREFERYPIVGA